MAASLPERPEAGSNSLQNRLASAHLTMSIGFAHVFTGDQNLDAQIEKLETAGCEGIYREKTSGATKN